MKHEVTVAKLQKALREKGKEHFIECNKHRRGKHKVFRYRTIVDGRPVHFNTAISHDSKKTRVGKGLLARIARQCKNLPLKKLEAFVKCSFSLDNFEAHV